MFRYVLGAGIALVMPVVAFAQESPLNRRDGFLRLWESILRPAYESREVPYEDVREGEPGFLEITYAKRRGLLGDVSHFRPTDPLTLGDAVLWLFRTRNVADPDEMEADDLPALLERYPIVAGGADLTQTVDAGMLERLMEQFDKARREERTQASLYGDEFKGQGTAFGEIFNPGEFTAAHRYFPHNTLVRVTNMENGSGVIARINDRGPYVTGRSIDLSVVSFTEIAPRSRGVITVTIERLGDMDMVDPSIKAEWEAQFTMPEPIDSFTTQAPDPEAEEDGDAAEPQVCDDFGSRYQSRITKDLRFVRGVPHTLKLGQTLNLRSTGHFVIRSVSYPDGNQSPAEQWIDPTENFRLKPSLTGTYRFVLGNGFGREREMEMRVIEC